MTPDLLSQFAKSVAAHADVIRTASAAQSVDLRFSAGDPAGLGRTREVAFTFADPVLAQAFITAFQAATAPEATRPAPVDAAQFTRR